MNESTPFISVIVPIYNVELYVEEAIISILTQTFQYFELIAVNDGSTDSSLSIVQAYANSDKRIRIITQVNQGLSAARNKGLAHAKGQYVYFFDSDDLLETDTFAICVKYIQSLNLDLIAFSGQAFADDDSCNIERFTAYQKPKIINPISGLKLLNKLYHAKSYSSSACLYIVSRHLINNNKLIFDEDFLHEDEAYTLILYCLAQRTISLENRLFKRRVRENSIMTIPKTFENIKGLIKGAVKIESFLCQSDRVTPDAREILVLNQRRLLRLAMRCSEDINETLAFILLIQSNFSMAQLLVIDSAILFFARANKLFVFLRTIKRNFSPLSYK